MSIQEQYGEGEDIRGRIVQPVAAVADRYILAGILCHGFVDNRGEITCI